MINQLRENISGLQNKTEGNTPNQGLSISNIRGKQPNKRNTKMQLTKDKTTIQHTQTRTIREQVLFS